MLKCLPHSLNAVFDFDQRTAMADSDRRPRDGLYLGDAVPTNSTTFRVLSTAVTFVLATRTEISAGPGEPSPWSAN
jgi:hypothetical protein